MGFFDWNVGFTRFHDHHGRLSKIWRLDRARQHLGLPPSMGLYPRERVSRNDRSNLNYSAPHDLKIMIDLQKRCIYPIQSS